MKRKHLTFAALLAALLSFGISSAYALPEAEVVTIKKAIAETPVLEIAPKAAEIVQKASSKDREDVAVAVVKAAISKRPTTAVAVVRAVVEVAPTTCAAVAAAATELAPSMAKEIAKAAVEFAPNQAADIATAVVKAAPDKAYVVTYGLVAAAPEASPSILESVVAAAPSVKAQIEKDPALTVVSGLARNSRSSASTVSTKSGNSNTPHPAGSTVSQPRSSGVANAINTLVSTANNSGSSTTGANLIKSGVDALNSVLSDTSATKEDKTTNLGKVTTALTAILGDSQTAGTDKANATQGLANALNTVFKNNSAGIDQTEKQTILNFISTAVSNTTTTSGVTGPEVTGVLNTIIQQTQQLIQVASTTSDSTQLNNAVNNSNTQVNNQISNYATP